MESDPIDSMEGGSMMGLMVLMFLAVYLLISVWTVRKTAGWAKASNRKSWLWGGLAAFVMYNLVFWDLIPTLVMHKHYCDTQAGFWVYKTPEQWKAENPGVEETLKQSLSPTRLGSLKPTKERTWVTQRFYGEVIEKKIQHSLGREENKFYDAKNGELIAKSVNFWRGKSAGVFGIGGTLEDLRQALVLGWGNRGCGKRGESLTDKFNIYVYQFWKSGQNK